ncbi:phosphotransferase [bacterium]|nr:phosphotransferase [bacterium]
MNQTLRDRYSPTVLAVFAQRYGVRPEEVTNLGGFESFVFAFSRDGGDYILKITHTVARSFEHLEGELEWLNYLADHGVPVSRAVPSLEGRLIEKLADESGEYLAIAYEKAPGTPIVQADMTPALYRTWGNLIGRMHALTRAYEPSRPGLRRQTWEEVSLAGFKVPEDHAWFAERAAALYPRLHALPKGPDAYGLVHSDLHFGNVLLHEGRLTAFDFDDAHYTWFANDVAITLFYVLTWSALWKWEADGFATEFLTTFLEGYREAAPFDDAWLAYFPDFLRLRRLVLYGALFQAFGPDEMPERERKLFETLRQGILTDSEVVDLDFTRFVAQTPERC